MILYKLMAKSKEKLKALKMRRTGRSVKDIARSLGVSKSSVSVWCRDIELTKTQRDRLTREQIKSGHKGRIIGANMNRQKRLDNIARQEKIAQKMIGKLTKRDKFMLGIALYWGEGVRASGTQTAIANSDPSTILFARDWFEQLGVARGMFRPYVFISEHHKPRAGKVLQFWSDLLDIPKDQFAKMVFLKGRPKKIYENHDSYYGVLSLRVRKCADLKYSILGLIKTCKERAGVA